MNCVYNGYTLPMGISLSKEEKRAIHWHLSLIERVKLIFLHETRLPAARAKVGEVHLVTDGKDEYLSYPQGFAGDLRRWD